MTILVTGGAGYIGSHMVLSLLDAREAVVVLDNLSTGFDTAVPPSAQLVIGDAGDQALVSSLLATHKIESIIHFAGSVSVEESTVKPLEYYRNNTMNTRSLIECAVREGVRNFIFSSTAAVYGNPTSMPVGEDASLAPLSPYGWSKLMTEVMLRQASEAHPIHHIILRYFNVAGADPQLRTGQSTKNATHLIKVAVEAALGRRPKLEVFGTDYPTPDGTCIRDYVHVSDLANAHCNALDYLRHGGQSITLNCGYGRGFSVLEVVEAVKRASGVDFRVEMSSRRAGDAAEIVARSTAAREILGWRVRFDDLDTIVAHALAWERKNMASADEQPHQVRL